MIDDRRKDPTQKLERRDRWWQRLTFLEQIAIAAMVSVIIVAAIAAAVR